MVVWTVSGALEVHLLALEDKLKGREAELTEEIVNATCTDGDFNEVSEYPSSSLSCPGHAIVPRLLVQVMGVGAAAAEQRRRPQPAQEREGWIIYVNSNLVGGFPWIGGDRQRATQPGS